MNKADKAELKKAKQIAKYSADYDMTIVIRYAFILFGVFLFQLFILEIVLRFVFRQADAQGYLTPEISHTIFGFIGGWVSAIVTFLAKRLADQRNAPQEPEKPKEETPQP